MAAAGDMGFADAIGALRHGQGRDWGNSSSERIIS
jgi:hypothetical protein